jgi:uncharacterized protein YbjT (DUF2867 family)
MANQETASTQSTAPLTLVLGGTGKTGHRVVDRLKQRGLAVRTGSRSGVPAFGWDAPEGWGAVLAGVRQVYLSYAPDLAIPGATDAVRRFVAQCVEAGVTRIVLLSGRGEEEAQNCEQIVRASGLEWTIVRASWFNQNFSEGAFLDMVLDGNITLPAGPIGEPFVDTDDIADVAVAALTEDRHNEEIYEVTGPRLLTFADVAHEISSAAGREVRFTRIPQTAFNGAIIESGTPEDIAWLLDYLFSTVLDGRNAHLCNGVERALGRPPRDFRDYCRDVAASGVWDIPSEPPAPTAKNPAKAMPRPASRTKKTSLTHRALLLAAGLVSAAIGATILIDPAAIHAGAGIELGHNPSLLSEIKAPGGLLVALGAFISAGAFWSRLSADAMKLSAALYLSYAASRLVSIASDGLPAPSLQLALAFELVLGLASAAEITRSER